jgi:predicted nucleic acid-binding protein
VVITHPFVIGELACGAMVNREEVLGLLEALPLGRIAVHTEVLQLIEAKRLYGRGIGWIDAHLLASTMLSSSTLWTSDQQLRRVAEFLGVAYGSDR